jgi:hypothetical protein
MVVPLIWLDEFGKRRPVRPCPRCGSEIPVLRLRVEGVHRDGWCQLVPMLGEVS